MSHWLMHPQDLTPDAGATLIVPAVEKGEKPLPPFKVSSSITDTLLTQTWQDAIVNVTPGELTPQPTLLAPTNATTNEVRINWNLTIDRTLYALRAFTKQLTKQAFQTARIQIPQAVLDTINSHRLEHHPAARQWVRAQPLIHPDVKRRHLIALVKLSLDGNTRHAAARAHRLTLKPFPPGSEAWQKQHQSNTRLLTNIAERLLEYSTAATIRDASVEAPHQVEHQEGRTV